MKTGRLISDYALGNSDAEYDRLIRQAARLSPFTERFLLEAGIAPGQRVLELGSGIGDLAMLVAHIVGPGGEVVGVEPLVGQNPTFRHSENFFIARHGDRESCHRGLPALQSDHQPRVGKRPGQRQGQGPAFPASVSGTSYLGNHQLWR